MADPPTVNPYEVTPNTHWNSYVRDLMVLLKQHAHGGVDYDGAGTLLTNDGTVSAPSHSYKNSTGMGGYRVGSNILGFATAGARRFAIDASGNVIVGDAAAALAVSATDGFLYASTMAGIPTGTPTSVTGSRPVVLDTTNHRLMAYTNAWRTVGPFGAWVASDATTTSTSAVDVTGLSVALPSYGRYHFEAHLKVGSSSAAGTDYAIAVPAGATFTAYVFGTNSSAGAFFQEQVTASGTLTTAHFNIAALTTAAQGAFVHIYGIITMGGTAGNLKVQHAKVTSGTSTVYAGSFMRVSEQA